MSSSSVKRTFLAGCLLLCCQWPVVLSSLVVCVAEEEEEEEENDPSPAWSAPSTVASSVLMGKLGSA